MANLWVKNSIASYRGPLKDNGEHSHRAAQLTFSSNGEMWVEINGTRHSVPGVLIAPQMPHRVEYFLCRSIP